MISRIGLFRGLPVAAALTAAVIMVVFLPSCALKDETSLNFTVSFPEELCAEPLDGRLLLLISSNGEAEPRFQISGGPNTQLVFGMDVEDWQPGEKITFDEHALGYPLESYSQLPQGEYFVQVLLHRYETFERADGHTIKLPMDRGEGQQWNRAPGNLYSTPQKLALDPPAWEDIVVDIGLDNIIPPFEEPQDTKYLKHLKIESKLLSEFWGRPMHLGAIVLLPEGFDEHPEARYPLVVYHGHFHRQFYIPVGFREQPPEPGLEGYDKTYAEYSHQFYQDWTGEDFPRVIILTIQHANPYYDDSYAVNSANLGPYGDAIVQELIPHVEERFRAIGEGWARVMFGGSTGGWEVLAAQIFYPDEFNGCWCACPDPIDFRAYTIVDIYEDKNAYYLDSEWKRTPRPGRRNWLGQVSSTLEEENRLELVLGDNARSGGQWDIWQAVFGPAGPDGYPRPIWDKHTGEIDAEVAEYWRENYDLRHILERDWDTLGPKLSGKIHIYCGDMDNYYLNNAVYLMEEFLEGTSNPYYGGVVEYGDRFEHCWSGDHNNPNPISRLTYVQRFIGDWVARITSTAPPGGDVTSWKY